jgi:hypothetical protein
LFSDGLEARFQLAPNFLFLAGFDFIDSDGFEVVASSTSGLLEDDDAVNKRQGSDGCLKNCAVIG